MAQEGRGDGSGQPHAVVAAVEGVTGGGHASGVDTEHHRPAVATANLMGGVDVDAEVDVVASAADQTVAADRWQMAGRGAVIEHVRWAEYW